MTLLPYSSPPLSVSQVEHHITCSCDFNSSKYNSSHWVTSLPHADECRGLTGDLPDISNKLSRAMAALQDRPVLFK